MVPQIHKSTPSRARAEHCKQFNLQHNKRKQWPQIRQLGRNSRSSNGRYGIRATDYPIETVAIEDTEQSQRRLAKSRISAVGMDSDCGDDDNWQWDVGNWMLEAAKRGVVWRLNAAAKERKALDQ